MPVTLPEQGQRISALSLNSIRAKRNLESSLEKVVVNPNDLPRNSFSFEQLMTEWNWYADKMSRNGLMLMYSLMGMTKPRLEGVSIHLELPNEGSRLSFSEQQADLASHLRKKLQNYDLEIKIRVNEEIQLVKKVFDTRDKYEHFVNLNPNMELLKQVFDLEFK
ncbi:MAG: DNA polymerase III subunit gamma/tau [Flavobacteriaceae bacterium]|jgi:hypothetical protein|nr:DNA polymerase III subunit gamma/tau [Flavobacteriaceae bacterium]